LRQLAVEHGLRTAVSCSASLKNMAARLRESVRFQPWASSVNGRGPRRGGYRSGWTAASVEWLEGVFQVRRVRKCLGGEGNSKFRFGSVRCAPFAGARTTGPTEIDRALPIPRSWLKPIVLGIPTEPVKVRIEQNGLAVASDPARSY